MTSDPNPLIDIPKFISTPIQNMVSEMSGGDHSFLKQLCKSIQNIDFTDAENSEFASLFTLIDSMMNASPEKLQQLWMGKLHSFDNRTLFQAIAEIVSISHLAQFGWQIESCSDACIRLRHPSNRRLDLLVLSLILDRNLEQEKQTQQELVDALNQLESAYHIGLTIRTPLSPSVDIPKIVALSKKWLAKVHLKGTTNQDKEKSRRVGYVKNATCHIDFRVIGPKKDAQSPNIYLVTPPVIGQKIQRNVNQMMSSSIEAIRQSRPNDANTPVLISVVTNQPLQLSDRVWKHLLYGLSHEETNGYSSLDTRHFGGWFQDPFRTFVGGVLRIEHKSQTRGNLPCFDSMTFSNPWCEFNTVQKSLPLPAYRFTRVLPTEYPSSFSKASWTLQKKEAQPHS